MPVKVQWQVRCTTEYGHSPQCPNVNACTTKRNKSINGLPLSYLLAPHFCHCSRLPINTQHSTLKEGGGGLGGGTAMVYPGSRFYPIPFLQDGTYRFTLTIEDYFGNVANVSRLVSKSAAPPPSLTLTHAASIEVYPPQPVVLSVAADSSNAFRCGGPPPGVRPALSYTWQCLSDPALLAAQDRQTPHLQIPPYRLVPGRSYLFMVDVFDPATDLTANEDVIVTVARSPLVARIAGSRAEEVPMGGRPVLDASPSHDPDSGGAAAPLTYRWAACFQGVAGDPTALPDAYTCAPVPLWPVAPAYLPAALRGLVDAQGPILTQPRGDRTPFPEGWYKFECTVRADTRRATATKWVRFVPEVQQVCVCVCARARARAGAWVFRGMQAGDRRAARVRLGPGIRVSLGSCVARVTLDCPPHFHPGFSSSLRHPVRGSVGPSPA